MSFVHNVEELIEAHGNGLTGKAAHWERVRLGEVAQVINGFPFPSGGFNNKAGEPVLRIRDITAGSVGTFFKGDVEGAPGVEHGDLVVGMDGDFNSRLWAGETALINQRVCRIAPDEAVYSKSLLAYALPGYLKLVNDHTSAVTVKHLSSRTIADFPLPLPPRREQDRLASKIDELFSRIDEGERALERVQKLVERYRQSVLKAAVTGELTREWREKNKDKLESGEALLARILKARREAWETAELKKMKAKGISPANDKWKLKYREPTSADTTGLSKLPTGWVWATVEQLSSKVVDGVHKKPSYVPAGVPFVTVKNLTAGPGISFDKLNHITPEDHAEFTKRTDPERGDVLISKDGTLGVVRVVRTDTVFSIFVSVALVKPVLRSMSEYLGLSLSSPVVQVQMVPKGSGLQHIHLEDLRRDCVPLCSLEEQVAIVETAERHLVSIDHFEKDLVGRAKLSSSLRQSILGTGFSGSLVEQDPSDEPASTLLDRIAAQRATDTATPKRGCKKKTTA
jgi:type I restriction enzyme, S subunit